MVNNQQEAEKHAKQHVKGASFVAVSSDGSIYISKDQGSFDQYNKPDMYPVKGTFSNSPIKEKPSKKESKNTE